MVITENAVREILALLPPSTFIAKYTAHVEKRTESHLGYQLMSALSMLTQTAPDQLGLFYGVDVYTNELFLLVGPSGAGRKGTAIQTARRILSDGDGGIPGAFTDAVVHGDIASDQGVQDQIAKQPRFLLPLEEFGDFLEKTQSPQNRRMRMTFNKLFDNTPAGRLKAGGKESGRTENRKNPRGTAIAGTTPDYLIDFTRRVDWTGGFMSRWLTFYPQDARSMEPPPHPDLNELKNLITLLRNKAAPTIKAPMLRCSGRTAVANDIWLTWVKSTRTVIKSLQNDVARIVLQRLEMHALKIALLIAWDLGECPIDGWQLSARALVPAIRFANLHALSMCRIVQEIPANDEAAERARILALIPEDPMNVSRATLLQVSDISARSFEAHVKTLMQANLVVGRGDEVAGSISYSRKFGVRARSAVFEDIHIWTPGRVEMEMDGDGAGGCNSGVAAMAQVIADQTALQVEREGTVIDAEL